MNKKGMLSIETIIVIILALIVLIIVAAAFSGGMTGLFKKIFGFAENPDQGSATTSCQSYCQYAQKDNYCRQINVKDIGLKTCSELGVTCSQPITCP
jgi:ABC-type lipoprotein release transport system permease subunit